MLGRKRDTSPTLRYPSSGRETSPYGVRIDGSRSALYLYGTAHWLLKPQQSYIEVKIKRRGPTLYLATIAWGLRQELRGLGLISGGSIGVGNYSARGTCPRSTSGKWGGWSVCAVWIIWQSRQFLWLPLSVWASWILPDSFQTECTNIVCCQSHKYCKQVRVLTTWWTIHTNPIVSCLLVWP